VRKVINGQSSVIARDDENGGYMINTWTKVLVVMKDDEIRIYFSPEGSAATEVFPDPITDKDLKDGTIALTTYKVANVIFDYVQMQPPDIKS
jgi:hypothetical protein